jgi:hypothetical protein
MSHPCLVVNAECMGLVQKMPDGTLAAPDHALPARLSPTSSCHDLLPLLHHIEEAVKKRPVSNRRPVTFPAVSPTQPTRLDVPSCARGLALLVGPFQDRVPSELEDRVKVSTNTPTPFMPDPT